MRIPHLIDPCSKYENNFGIYLSIGICYTLHMISLLKFEDSYQVLGRGTVLTFDTRTQPMAEKIRRGDHFRVRNTEYQAVSIERSSNLMSPPSVSPIIGIVVREVR